MNKVVLKRNKEGVSSNIEICSMIIIGVLSSIKIVNECQVPGIQCSAHYETVLSVQRSLRDEKFL